MISPIEVNSSPFAKIEPHYSLRPYQKKAVNEIAECLLRHKRALLHAPTGAGKTRMAMSFITRYLRQHGPTMVLWLAPTQELIRQASKDFQKAWKLQGDVPAVAIEWHGRGESFSHGTTIDRNTMLIGGLQMASQSVRLHEWIEKSLHNKVGLVVFDEAHQSVARTYRELVENLVDGVGERMILLGLSATPGRADEEESEALASMYGLQKIGIGDGSNPVHYLQSRGYIAKANVVVDSFDGSPIPSDSGQDYSSETLADLGRDDVRNQRISEIVKKLFEQGHRRVLAFTPSIKSAETCAEMLREVGYRYSNAVSGETKPELRDHYIDTYSIPLRDSPDPQVIFNCNVLTAGFDVPQTSAAVIGMPTKSLVRLQQMMGRALRGPKSGGNESADIRILADESYEQFTTLADLFRTWDRLWEPIKDED